MRRATVAALVAATVLATPAGASTWLQLGVVDTQEALGNQARFGRTLGSLRPQIVRIMLGWGGSYGVAREDRPAVGTDPSDPAYDWRLYDQAVLTATARGARVMFTIFGTPQWANYYQAPNVPPQNFTRLKEFAYAAALRYSGLYRRADGVVLPRVSLWTAWNEPNIPLGLKQQWRRLGGRWVIHSAWVYARICNAVYDGIHLTLLRGEQVACGVTTARGNNAPGTRRPSVAPIGFVQAMKAAGLRTFDAYAHHPYSGDRRYAPGAKPRSPRAITLGNIQKLINEVTRLYGPKPIWITEYGYETSPPDRVFGVAWKKQAAYLREAYGIARRNPRIEMLLWFLARDEARMRGWQSGFVSAGGRRKPSFYEFQTLAAAQRISGRQDLAAMMADIERALGRPERAIALFERVDRSKLAPDTAAELLLVAASAYGDIGQPASGVALIRRHARWPAELADHDLRLAYAEGALAEQAGDLPRARAAFARVAQADPDFHDAADRLAQLTPG